MFDPFSGSPKLKPLNFEQSQLLEAQKIDHLNPGTIVHDFQVLLDYVGRHEVPVAGKLSLLPIGILHELNGQMHEPLVVKLQRPQLKSYPNLQQLYLLLRATELGQVEGSGKKARLRLDRELLESWNALNPTERYFNLLEAFVDRGNPEILGERVSGFFAFEPIQMWIFTLEGMESARNARSFDREYVRYHAAALALMWLFGFIRIEQGPADRKDGGWRPKRATPTEFGKTILQQLQNYRLVRVLAEEGLPLSVEGDDEEFLVEDESDESGSPLAPKPLGEMQLVFQEHFPEWKNNLVAPERPSVDGQFILKVSLSKTVWRRLKISSKSSFDDLATLILNAFEFDDDHLYEFIFKQKSGVEARLVHSFVEEGTRAADVSLGSLSLSQGARFMFHYDFGDDWMFEVLVEQIEASTTRRTKTAIIETQGKAPEQYPGMEDWE